MKKLLLTLLLLFSVGMVAMAVTEELTTTLLSGNGTAYADARTYTSTTSGLSYKMGAAINSGKFQQNKSKGCFFEVTANTKGVKITNIQLVGLSSKTASYFKAKASDSHLTVNVASAGKGTGSITGGTAVALNGDSFAPNNTFFSYYVTSSASMFTFSKIIVTYEDAAPAEKIELEDAKLEVKAGEQVLGSKAELDANTTISWNYNYTGEVANPDITYTYSVDRGEDVEGNSYTFTGEKDVKLTVKATSENIVSKTVKLLMKYPTVCPKPVFNVEDGAKVYAGQAVTVSCEGADIKWTVNDATITGTSYTITEKVGTQLTFYALASIKGRNPSTGIVETLMAEKEINVTVTEAPDGLTIQFISDGESDSNSAFTTTTELNSFITEGTEYVSGIQSTNNVYNGIGGLKFSSKNHDGKLNLSLSADAQIYCKQIVVRAKKFGSDSSSLSVNGVSKDITATEYTDYVFDMTSPYAKIETLELAATKRLYVQSVMLVEAKTATSVEFGQASVILAEGATATQQATVTPEGVSVTYSSSDETVATVNAKTGEVTAGTAGTAKITATVAADKIHEGSTASYSVTVVAKGDVNKLEGEITWGEIKRSLYGWLTIPYSFKLINYDGAEIAIPMQVVDAQGNELPDLTYSQANTPRQAEAAEVTIGLEGEKMVNGTMLAAGTALGTKDNPNSDNLKVRVNATVGGTALQDENTEIESAGNTATGIEDVTVDGSAEAEYYNLQGLRVAQPEAGQLYIKRQGGKAVKVRF